MKNPPAFPNCESISDDPAGMELLDYFAAKALTGILSNPNIGTRDVQMIAYDSFEVAEAMLTEREKRFNKTNKPTE